MKILFLAVIGALCAGSVIAAEPRVVPASPSLEELADKAQVAVIVLTCIPNADRSGLSVTEVLKGQKVYTQNKQQIAALMPSSDPKALATDGYRELVFIGPPNAQGIYLKTHTIALWPARSENLGPQTIRFLAHDYAKVKRAINGKDKQEAQQAVPPNGP